MFCFGSYPILPPPPVPPQVLSLLPQPTTDFCSRHTSRITFHISIILAGLMALIDCMIRFWSISVVIMTLDLQGQICYIISQQKLSTERKTIISMECWASNIVINFHLDHDLEFQFSRSNIEFAISCMVWLPRNEKWAHWLNTKPQMWPSIYSLALTLTFTRSWIPPDICLEWLNRLPPNEKKCETPDVSHI